MFRAGLLIAILFPVMTAAQTVATSSLRPGTSSVVSGDKVEQVRLGDSVTSLVGPWKFHTGDDPAWSQPGFDDSSWADMDLTQRASKKHPDQLLPLPGWTARGYPDYSGYAWYRLTVDVQGSGQSLSLKMPYYVDDAYQVFINGTQIGQFGKFRGRSVTAYNSLPRAFPLPKDLTSGRMTIAIRLWMDSATPFNSPDAGGLHSPPQLGYAKDIGGQIRLQFDDIAHLVGSGFLESLILVMALLMAAALYWLDPTEEAYFWLALVCLVTLLGNSVVLLANFTTPMGQTKALILHDVLATPIRIGLWVMFWAYWFRLPKLKWIHWIVWPLVTLLAIGTLMLRPPLYGQKIPVDAANFLSPTLTILKLCLGALLLVVAYLGFRRNRTEGGMAGAAVMLAFAANFQHELQLIHIAIRQTVFGFAVTLGTISTILSILIITVMLLRRFVYSQRQQEQWKMEIEQAKGIQNVLIPEKLPDVKGLRIRSEYHPAREVGGDFFQILPLDDDGDALIIVGDVTGKGLQAGMLVALIVGAIQTAAKQHTDPARILTIINDQMSEREHASGTCVILRISSNGAVTMAHAGHLPPYLNGIEIPMEGALPLGMVSGVDFPSQSLQLQPGDEVTLMSDGVAEAQDPRGRLFGFDRVHEMMSGRATAEEVAVAAQKFGQADDITVLQVQWLGQGAARALAPEPHLAAH